MTYRSEFLLMPPAERSFEGPEAVPGEYWIYYHLAESGEVLYIGKTCTPAKRTRQHFLASPWYATVDRFVWFGPMDEINAAAVERELISVEQPPNNIRHTDREIHARQTPTARLKSARGRVERLEESLGRARSLVARLESDFEPAVSS